MGWVETLVAWKMESRKTSTQDILSQFMEPSIGHHSRDIVGYKDVKSRRAKMKIN